jgi:hypothetical protein
MHFLSQAENPMTPAMVTLGEKRFFEKRLC